MITRRDLLVALVTTSATVVMVVLAQSAKPLMPSRIFPWSDLKATPTPAGERRAVLDTATANLTRLECHITTLDPGAVPHAGHRHPEEELMIVKEGTLEAIQNDTTNQVTAGGIIFEAANEYHGVRNAGTNRATYYVLKWYPYDLAKPEAK